MGYNSEETQNDALKGPLFPPQQTASVFLAGWAMRGDHPEFHRVSWFLPDLHLTEFSLLCNYDPVRKSETRCLILFGQD